MGSNDRSHTRTRLIRHSKINAVVALQGANEIDYESDFDYAIAIGCVTRISCERMTIVRVNGGCVRATQKTSGPSP